MRFKTVVAMACIATHLLLITDTALARSSGWKAFSRKISRAVNKAAGQLADVVVPVAPQIGATIPAVVAQLGPDERTVAGMVRVTNMLPDQFNAAAMTLLQLQGPLTMAGLTLASSMEEVEHAVQAMATRALGISDIELFVQLMNIERELQRSGAIHLLQSVARPDEFLSGLEDSLMPLSNGTTTLLKVVRMARGELQAQMVNKDSEFWSLARGVLSLAAFELDKMRALNRLLTEAQPPRLPEEEDEHLGDELSLFDAECGFLPLPLRFGGMNILVPMDRKVPLHCAGVGQKVGSSEFVAVSSLAELRRQAHAITPADARDHIPYQVFYKGNQGVTMEGAVEVYAELGSLFPGMLVGMEQVANILGKLQVKFPMTWSKPEASSRTLSQSATGDVVSNAHKGVFGMTPAVEVTNQFFRKSMPNIAAAGMGMEFPMSCSIAQANPGCLLNQLNVKVGGEMGFRWASGKTPTQIKSVMQAMRTLVRLSRFMDGSLHAAYRQFNVNSALDTLIPNELLPVLEQLLNTSAVLLEMLIHTMEGDGLMKAAASEDLAPEVSGAIAGSMFFLGGSIANIAKTVGMNEAVIKKVLKAKLGNQSTVKVEVNFGFLNAHHVKALADKSDASLPNMNAGFELVRPGTPDYIAFEITQRPDIASFGIEVPPTGPVSVAMKINGPYVWFKTATVWPVTYAGKLFLDNGSDQYEPVSFFAE